MWHSVLDVHVRHYWYLISEAASPNDVCVDDTTVDVTPTSRDSDDTTVDVTPTDRDSDDTSVDATPAIRESSNAAAPQHTLSAIVIIVITCSVARLVHSVVF